MRRLGVLLAALAAFGAAAASANWIIVSPSARAVAGEAFDVQVVAPAGERLPDEITVRMRVDVAELLLDMRAAGPAIEGRRAYIGIMPSSAAGQVTLELADRSSNALVMVASRRDTLQALTGLGSEREPPLSENDPMYFVVGTRDGTTARFQLSFKYRLFDLTSGFGQDQPWLSGFYFGYTQNSLWDLSSDSRAFRDTSYRPSLFWKWERPGGEWRFDGARLGFEHESNGGAGELSRSINILFLRPEWRWRLREGGSVEFTPKIYGYVDKEDNPDIDDYRGYVDWRLRFDSGNWIATTVVRIGTQEKGSLQIDLSRRTRDLKFGPVSTYLHLQFFTGYGEDILDYNVRRKSQLRLGFAIVP